MTQHKKTAVKAKNSQQRIYNARPDSLDFRDLVYVPTLFEVPSKIDLSEYQRWKVPILDQGQEGACTGFGLATVVHYLLLKRKVIPDPTVISPRMLYEMAKRYDEWPGEDYDGSSARGAMKGWHKHGVCAEEIWPYSPINADRQLTEERSRDAAKRPLGSYFRVNHQDLVSIHTAIAEVGILYATSTVHSGWNNVSKEGFILLEDQILGGHAFAIVAYDNLGFWIQNSWGSNWGLNGFAHITYDDWLIHGSDIWVSRLGAAVNLNQILPTAISHSAAANNSLVLSFADLRPHIISIGNNGLLKSGGDFGTSPEDIQRIFQTDLPRITQGWQKKRILLYAHGGLTDEKSAVQRLAEYRAALISSEVYPISFIWNSDLWSSLSNILGDALSRRRPEGVLDNTKDFMLDRLDDAIEPLVRIPGKALWDEMKENALMATTNENGGARLALQQIAKLAQDPTVEIHIVGHSAGAIFHAAIIQLLTASGKITTGEMAGVDGYNLSIESCTLWAPACTIDLFEQTYRPAINSGHIKRFALFTLKDGAEQNDNCAHIYNKSLLYLVSNAFETKPRIPLFRDGEPILGMEKFINDQKNQSVKKIFESDHVDWILTPNNDFEGSDKGSNAQQHGGFDDDIATVKATLARILNISSMGTGSRIPHQVKLNFNHSASSLRTKRKLLP
jgi:Papain family cysteine protease